MRRIHLTASVLLLAWSSMALAGSGDRWLHIRVIDHGPGGEKVRVNVPLAMAEKILPMIDADDLHDGHLRINGHGDLDARDLREMWSAIREGKDGVYVTVEGEDEDVRVAREGAYMMIKVDEHGRHGDKVDVRIPLTVVDALLSGDGDELDFGAAIRALSDHGDGELVSVVDDDSHVRIWVDADQAGKEKGDD
jgi:hypothetical protein